MNFSATIRNPPTPQPELFSLEEEPGAGGSRPDRIATLSAPQERDLRRSVQHVVMEHIFDFVCFPPMVPFLDDPAPQMVEQLPDVLHFFVALIPDRDQVIEVPKILPEDVPLRAVLRATQLVEQLVEVSTIFSQPPWRSCR